MGNSGGHDSSPITNYQLFEYTKRTLYNNLFIYLLTHKSLLFYVHIYLCRFYSKLPWELNMWAEKNTENTMKNFLKQKIKNNVTRL